jgi:hypothetical protein
MKGMQTFHDFLNLRIQTKRKISLLRNFQSYIVIEVEEGCGAFDLNTPFVTLLLVFNHCFKLILRQHLKPS